MVLSELPLWPLGQSLSLAISKELLLLGALALSPSAPPLLLITVLPLQESHISKLKEHFHQKLEFSPLSYLISGTVLTATGAYDLRLQPRPSSLKCSLRL